MAKVDRGAGYVDRPAKTFLREFGQLATVVDVSVEEDNRVDFGRRKRKPTIFFIRLGACTLEESAVKQDSLAAELDLVG